MFWNWPNKNKHVSQPEVHESVHMDEDCVPWKLETCSRVWVNSVDALRAPSTNMQDSVGRICPKHSDFPGMLHQRVRNCLTIPTLEAVKQLQFTGKPQPQNTQPKDDAYNKLPAKRDHFAYISVPNMTLQESTHFHKVQTHSVCMLIVPSNLNEKSLFHFATCFEFAIEHNFGCSAIPNHVSSREKKTKFQNSYCGLCKICLQQTFLWRFSVKSFPDLYRSVWNTYVPVEKK